MYCKRGWEKFHFGVSTKARGWQDFLHLVSQPRQRIQMALPRSPESAAMWGHLPSSLSCYVSSLCTHEFELFSLPLLSRSLPPVSAMLRPIGFFHPRGVHYRVAKIAPKILNSIIVQETTDGTDTSGVRLRPCNANEVLLSISEGGLKSSGGPKHTRHL